MPTAAYRLLLSVLALLAIILGSCHRIHLKERFTPTFEYADVRIAQVRTAWLGGRNVTGARQATDLSAATRKRLAAVYANGPLLLKLRVELELRNPSQETVVLTDLRYQTLVDGQLVAEGHTTKSLKLPSEGRSAILRYTVAGDVQQKVSGLTPDQLTYFALRLADQSRRPVRVTMRLQPTFRASNGRCIPAREWVVVDQTFTASSP